MHDPLQWSYLPQRAGRGCTRRKPLRQSSSYFRHRKVDIVVNIHHPVLHALISHRL
ncbi:MAG: hypothetical protein ACK55Z_36725 [bacterium]